MMNSIFSPIGVFFMFMAVTGILYYISGFMSPKPVDAEGKNKMYACGEDLPARPLNPSVQMFFHVILFFTLMDVAALTLATLPQGNTAFMGLIYLLGIVLSVVALMLR